MEERDSSATAPDVSDDESDSVSLDLHVSDTEDSTPCNSKKDTMESEDEILNKFVDEEEESSKDKLVNGHSDNSSEHDEQENKDLQDFGGAPHNCKEPTDVGNKNAQKETLEKVAKRKESTDLGREDLEEKSKNADKNKTQDLIKENDNDKSAPDTNHGNCEGVENSDCAEKIKLSKTSDQKAEKSDEETPEEEDLLQVMETSFADETDKDENSCSSSEKDENAKEGSEDSSAKSENSTLTAKHGVESIDENKETEEQVGEDDSRDNEIDDPDRVGQEKTNEENKEVSQAGDGSYELQSDNLEGCGDELNDVDNNEYPMDIEENNIGGVIITDHEQSSENHEGEPKEEETPSKMAPVDTEVTSDRSVNGTAIDDIVNLIDIDVDEGRKKPGKRPRTREDRIDATKKMKTEGRPKVRTTRTLNSLKQYMKEKGLKSMTRTQLEELCLQKMCECLIDKSELADLRQKVRLLEHAIDNFRKEALTVANQTRDLKIVHEKVSAALQVAKEQKGKHLVPVKITRSVGLQAVLEHLNRRLAMSGILQNGRINNNSLNNNNIVNVNNNGAKHTFNGINNNMINTPKSPVKPQQTGQTPVRSRTVQSNNKQVSQKENRAVPSPRTTPTQQTNNASRKSTEAPKAVIDLTDEDEKSTTTSPNSRANRVTNGNARMNGGNSKSPPTLVATTNTTTKLMMIPSTVLSTRPVMLKVNSNVVSQANNAITIPPTSQVSIVAQPVVSKSTQQARTGVTNVTSSRSSHSQKFRHPAPLPPPPPQQNQITTQRLLPPKPFLNLTRSLCGTGIVLQWKMPYQLELYESIVSYQLYAYQETKTPPRTDSWGKIGDVKALELPMAVTLTQFAVGNRYYFAVRAVDVHKRLGPFSDPQTILL